MTKTVKMFVHGVPDSPAVWGPLLRELGLDPAIVRTPVLPGFHSAAPSGFGSTKDEYVDWLLGEVEALHADHGPVDVVGHDWGALLVARAASLRPHLFRTWTVSNAVIDPEYRGHRVARMWNTPVLGEVVVMAMTANRLRRALEQGGVPHEVAAEEAEQWRAGFAWRSILRLYRSAVGLRFSGAWVDDLERLPPRGLVVWGRRDPFVDLRFAQRFCEQRGVALEVIDDAGHWAIAQSPREVARILRGHWEEG